MSTLWSRGEKPQSEEGVGTWDIASSFATLLIRSSTPKHACGEALTSGGELRTMVDEGFFS